MLATTVPFYNTVFLRFAIETKNKKQIHNFWKAQSRKQSFEEPHAARVPQFGHPCNIICFEVNHCEVT